MADLTIRQIENPAPGKQPRELFLAGWAGPVESLEWDGSQRSQVEPIPQSGASSVRLDGPEEEPTVFHFMWKNRLIEPGDAKVDGTDIASADELVATIVSMRRDTALVEVSFAQWLAVGFIQNTKPMLVRAGEYTCDVEIKWVQSPGYERVDATAARIAAPSFLESLADGFEAAMTDIARAATFAQTTVDEATQNVADTREAIYRARRNMETLGNIAQDGIGVRRAMGASIEELAGLTGTALDTLAVPFSEIAQTDDPVTQITARAYRAEQAAAYRRLRHRSALERGRYSADGDILGVHFATEGETLWLVSWLWYRTTEFADFLGRVNGLRMSTLRGGQRILIPRRPSAPDRPTYLPRAS